MLNCYSVCKCNALQIFFEVSQNFVCGSGFRNVPYDWINKQKSNQNWLRKEGEKFLFPGGGTMFPRGVSEYVDLMQSLIPEMKDGTVRTAIDTGCGVSNQSSYLLCRNERWPVPG